MEELLLAAAHKQQRDALRPIGPEQEKGHAEIPPGPELPF
jgi:hypothetical protein